MNERDRRSEFLEFMRMPDGSPLATIDVLDYLTNRGFFAAPASTKYHGNSMRLSLPSMTVWFSTMKCRKSTLGFAKRC